MKDNIHLIIVGTEDILYYGLVNEVTLPSCNGSVTIHPGDYPQTLLLARGTVGLVLQNGYNEIKIKGGQANIQPDKVSIVIK